MAYTSGKFDPAVRQELLALPRVGERVLARFERVGLTCIDRLAQNSAQDVIRTFRVAASDVSPDALTWLRSSKARASIEAVLRFARQRACQR